MLVPMLMYVPEIKSVSLFVKMTLVVSLELE